ncbi:MAG: hypothetical protein ACM3X7_00815 [Solirubrobacterales bacterium]
MSVTMEAIMNIEQNDISKRAALLEKEDIEQLVDWLSLKEDSIRYRAFLLLQAKSVLDSSVYPFWDVFRMKLTSDNSYQRSIGVMLIAENVKWDVDCKMKGTMADYLSILKDEKVITIRQCIQSLKTIVQNSQEYTKDIGEALLSNNIMSVRETMRKLILLDIINTLVEIKKYCLSSEISQYIFTALSGEVLDKKSKKVIEKLL